MVVLAPSPEDFDELARERLNDAQALLDAGQYAGAHYMCGYAMEMKLKSRICKTHGWKEYPPQKLTEALSRALKTHNLADLLLFASPERTIEIDKTVEWSMVAAWNPNQRYTPSAVIAEEARAMIAAVTTLMMIL
jgi:hypothetical protein